MRIRVELYVNLRKYSPNGEKEFDLDLPTGSTLKDLIHSLGIPAEVALVMLVNGRPAEARTHLAHSDKVTLFPPLGGG